MEMLLTGEMIDGEEARAHRADQQGGGAGNPGKRDHGAGGARSPPSRAARCKTGKEAFYRQLEMPLAEAYAYASQVMTENMLDAEACEGIGAFLEKREPKWPS